MEANRRPSIPVFRWMLLCMLVISVLGCRMAFPPGTPTPPPQPTLVPGECGSPEPTDADVTYALSLGKGLFDEGDWERSYSVSHQRVSVTWTSVQNNAVVFADYLIFECGFEDDILTSYFNDELFQVILSNYDSYRLADTCSEQGVKLWEFDANDQGRDYSFWFWAQPQPPTRVLSIVLVFPADQPALLAQYAGKFFPQLPACK
jgi:hypothetical protein